MFGRNPDRFPDVIVRAQTNGDVVAAVQLAKERGALPYPMMLPSA
jgi:hypothetical protein